MFLVPLLVTKPKLLTEKQMHKLKVSSYVLSGDLTEDCSIWETASQILRHCSKEVKEETVYIGIFAGEEQNPCS